MQLGDIGYTYNGLTGKSKTDFGHGRGKYITFLNVLNNTIIDSSILEDVNVLPNEKQNAVQKGDLFFNTSSETPEEVGMCAVLDTDLPATFLNSFCFGFRLKNTSSNYVLPLFLVHLFNGKYGRDIMKVLAQGATRYNLSKEQFLKTTIAVPDIRTQYFIVDVLTNIENTISSIKRLTSKYESIKKATVKKLMTKNVYSKMIRLGDVADIYRGGSPRPIQKYITDDIKGINWIKIGDVSADAKYIEYTKERIIPDGVSMSRQVKSGDLILSNSMSFGRPYILKINGCIHDGWLSIQNYQSTFDVEFLYYLLGSDFVMDQYAEFAAGSSVKNLNKEIVGMIHLPSLPITQQRDIVTQISAIDYALESLINKQLKQIKLKKSMLQYFFG